LTHIPSPHATVFASHLSNYLVAAIFALSSKDSNVKLVLLAYLPVFMFWWLDAFILHQEKLYRELYNGVANGSIPSDKFTTDTECVRHLAPSIYIVFFSKTLRIFYGIIVTLIVFAMWKIL